MSEVKIKRRQRTVNITLSTSTSAASTLRMDDMAGGIVSLGTMSTNASTLHMYAAEAEDGSYRRLYDYAGSPANIALQPSTSVGTSYGFPDAAFAAPWLKIVSGDTNSTGVTGFVTFKG